MAGLSLDFGIGMDYYLTLSGGDSGSGIEFFLHFADLDQVSGFGTFLGGTGAGATAWPIAFTDVEIGIENSSAFSVTAADALGAASVTTGIELKILLSLIGDRFRRRHQPGLRCHR